MVSTRKDLESDAAAKRDLLPFPQEYEAIYKRSRKLLLSENDNKSGNWDLMKGSASFERNPLDLESCRYKKVIPNGNPNIICMRGRLRFPHVTPREVLDMILDLPNRVRYDPMMESGEVKIRFNVGTINNDGEYSGERSSIITADIGVSRYSGRAMLKKRDLCMLRVSEDLSAEGDESCLAMYASSVIHDAVPVDAKGRYVRADLLDCGYMMQLGRRGDGDSFYTDVTVIISLDLKGSIPTFIANHVATEQPAVLQNMRKLFEG